MPHPRFTNLAPEKQHLFLGAAREEFALHPYSQASLNRILARADSNKGSFYYYFENKLDLFQAVLREALGHYRAHLFGRVNPEWV